MPNIRPYNAPALGLQPTEIGVEATAGAARRIGLFYNQTADAIRRTGQEAGSAVASAGDAAVDYMDHQQISAGSAKDAELTANLTENWNTAVKNADPNDPSLAQKWKEEQLEPALKDFQSGFSTEKSEAWAMTRADRLREHFFQKTSADMSSLASQAVGNNVREISNRFSNTAESDPSSVPFLLDSVDHSVGGIVGSSPNLKGADAGRIRMDVSEKTKEQIVKAGALGAIQKSADPEKTADDWSRKYPQYINGAEARTFARAAAAQNRTNLATQKQIELLNKQLGADNARQRANDVMTNNVQFDAQGRATISPQFFQQAQDIAKMPHAPDGLARTLIDWGQSQQRERRAPAVSDPDVKQQLFDGLIDGSKTPTDILKAEIQGGISHADTGPMLALQKELEQTPIKDPVFKQATTAARLDLGTDPEGRERSAMFMQGFIPQYLDAKRTGTLKPGDMDIKNPNSMISKAMQDYQRSPAEKQQARIMGNLGQLLNAPVTGGGAPPTAPSSPPVPGAVVKGYRFKGGDPAKQENWVKE